MVKTGDAESRSVRNSKRSAEILAVFAAHNFYASGLTPVEMRTTLEDLGPTYVKIGQILSSRTDILPEEYCTELARLRSDVTPLPASVARKVIESETGQGIEDVYAEFQDEPLGSASIAQAHYGVLKDGTRVVTKVQRPLIGDMMRRDFVLLRKLANFVGVVSGEEDGEGMIDLASVVGELERVTEEELDFRVEATHTKEFRKECIEDPEVVSCPTIVDELTSRRILTMTYIDGYSLEHGDRIDADGYDRHTIAEALLASYMHQILDVGIFHGDPHQGNIMLSGGIPYWIDFGMVGHVDDRSVRLFQTVVLALISRDTETMVDSMLALDESSRKVDKPRLIEDVDGLIERYATVGSLGDLDVSSLMSELTELMDEHSLSMPSDYTMLVRGLVTIEGVIEELCPDYDVFEFITRKMMDRARADFDIAGSLVMEAESLVITGKRAAKLPSLTYDVLRNLAKGRMKVNLELTGYDELANRLGNMVQCVMLAAFACVLFLGSCLLCSTDIQPKTHSVPLVALIGFVFSVALGIYAIRQLRRK